MTDIASYAGVSPGYPFYADHRVAAATAAIARIAPNGSPGLTSADDGWGGKGVAGFDLTPAETRRPIREGSV